MVYPKGVPAFVYLYAAVYKYSLSLDNITMKASMITNLLLISSVRSPSEHEADNVEHKHGADCC